MPIYEYRCSKCRHPREIVLPMSERDLPQMCLCGEIMQRTITLPTFTIKEYGKNLVTNTLNREYKTLPPKQVELMAGGLTEPERPVIGKGF